MNRALLLLLSLLTINLFGKVLSPEMLKTIHLPSLASSRISNEILTTPARSEQEIDPLSDYKILADTVPPVINCPASDTIILIAQGQCDTILSYSVTATDNQGTAIVIQLSGFSSGSVFPIGLSTCVYLATDLAGNTATCSFVFTVKDAGVSNLVCNDLALIELDANCTKTLHPQEVLQAGPYGCWSRYSSELDKTLPFGNGPWQPAIFGAADVGQIHQYRVTDAKTGNRCWGNVKILDKTPPIFNCQDFTVSCAENNLIPAFLRDSLGINVAIPAVNDACGPLTFLGHTSTNLLFNCDSPFTEIITRQWQANDQSGNTSTCIQRIKLHRHTAGEMQIPPDVTLTCPANNIAPAVTGRPFLLFQGRRYDLENNSICDISAFYKDSIKTLSCGDQHIRRHWEYFDFCTGLTVGPFVQNIYIIDESGPSVACPASLFVTLNADSCRGMLNMPDVVLSDGCSHLASFQAFWVENGLSKTLLGSLTDFIGNDSTGFDTLGVMGMALLPVGTTTISYVAEDSCGNIGDCTFNLTVADMVPPVARCDTFSTFQLLEDGSLSMSAASFDNGSTDACTLLQFKARFLETTPCLIDTIFYDTLQFCCLNQNDTINALLRVYDIPVPFGTVSTTFGNGHYSDCVMKITVTDSHPPLCVAPPNVTVNCETFDPTLENYGIITSISCAVDSITMEVDYAQFDTVCNRGTIVRIFKVSDELGNIGACAQAIQVDYLQDYYTKFPNDVIVTVCNDTGIYGEPTFFGQDCEDFDVDFTDQVYTVVPDACIKIERSWRISNKCTYDPAKPLIYVPNPNPSPITNHASNLIGPVVSACNALSPWNPSIIKINPPDPAPTNYCTFYSDSANGYEYKQIIKIIDGQAPTGTYTVPACANQNWATTNNTQLWNEPYWTDPLIGGNDLFEEPTELSITGTDACTGGNVNIEYLLFLDLDGDGVMETVINSVNVGTAGLGWNNLRFNNFNTPGYVGGTPRAFDERPVMSTQKLGFAIEESTSGKNKTAWVRWNTQQQPTTYFPPELPHGTHKIKWFITDNCGNNKEYEYTFTVKDCKKPTVVCLEDLSVNVLSNDMIQLFASDFLQFTEDNCTPAPQITIGIRKCGTGTGFPVNANGTPAVSVVYTCTELGTQCVELWAIDKAGNADYCEATLNVLDNSGNCATPGNDLAGRVITELGFGVAEVSIEGYGLCPFCPPTGGITLTDGLGYYAFSNQIPLSADFIIEPVKDDNPLNGVTTFDLVLISKHILGIEPLNSPYKMISADANKSGSITTFDIVEIRKIILGIYPTFANNTSWRFVDSSFVFPNPLNPFQTVFPGTIPLSNPAPYNFIGMKVGDVNLTAIPNILLPTDERFEGAVYFDVEDREVLESEIFELKFTASEQLEGCQLTLETDGLEILEILPGENMSKENFALFPLKSMLTMAWETGGRANFALKARAQKAGNLRDMLRIGSQITPAEAYLISQSPNIKIPKARIALRFGNSSPVFELLQNQPNPFKDKTAITFQLPEASPAVLTILDESGRVLWSHASDWSAGMNTVEIDLIGLSGAGILYYKLETPTKNAVRKMVRI